MKTKIKIILLILLIIIFALSSIRFFTEFFTDSDNKNDTNTAIENNKEQINAGMDELFIKEIVNKYEGEYEPKILAKGDLNKDGFEDALIQNEYCGASCSFNFSIVLNKDNKSVILLDESLSGFENGIRFSGANKSDIKEVKIENGIIYISGYGLDISTDDFTEEDWNINKTIKFNFEVDKVVRLK